VSRWEGWGVWRGRVGGWVNDVLQHKCKFLCTVGQTDGHRNPDHTTRRADIEWNCLGSQATLLMHPRAPMVCDGSAWLDRFSKKLSVKTDLIYGNSVTVSEQCLSI